MREEKLSHGFQDRSADQSEMRMKNLMRRVCESSQIGAETLSEATARGCKYVFSDELGSCLGTYFREKKLVALNPKCSDADLASTLVHEARHAVQKAPLLSTEKSICSLLTGWRAAEADAMAFECAAVYEMRNIYPEAWFNFKYSHKNVALAYSRTEKEPSEGKTPLGEAFKAWFDDASYVARYDREALNFLEDNMHRAGWSFLRDDVSGKNIALNLCRSGSSPYLPDTDFLDSKRALTVGEDIALRCRRVADDALLTYGRKDLSLTRLFVRSYDGSVRPAVRDDTPAHVVSREKNRQELNDALREALPPWAMFKKRTKGR